MVAAAPYPTQVLTFWFAFAIPVVLMLLVIGTVIYNQRRKHRRPPAS